MTTRANRVFSAVLFAVLWTAGMLFWSSAIDSPAIIAAVIAGVIAGGLWYWLFDKINTLFRPPR